MEKFAYPVKLERAEEGGYTVTFPAPSPKGTTRRKHCGGPPMPSKQFWRPISRMANRSRAPAANAGASEPSDPPPSAA